MVEITEGCKEMLDVAIKVLQCQLPPNNHCLYWLYIENKSVQINYGLLQNNAIAIM